MEIKFDRTITGQHIILRKVEISDAEDIFNWRSGLSGQFMRQPDNYSIKSQEIWINSREQSEINYIILDKKTKRKVGTIGIYEVNNTDEIANVGRLLLANEFLGKPTPYGLEALLIAYDYVFNVLNFRKITGDILAGNIAMYKLQKFLGMKEEGYLEKHVVIKGEFEDIFIMSIFKDKFNNYYQKKINFLLKSFK